MVLDHNQCRTSSSCHEELATSKYPDIKTEKTTDNSVRYCKSNFSSHGTDSGTGTSSPSMTNTASTSAIIME